MARVQSKELVGGQGEGRLMQAALSQQISQAGQSSNRIREAAEQQRIQSEYQGPADLGAGIARGITTAAQVTQRKGEMALERERLDEEVYQRHLDRNSRERMAVDMETAGNRRYLAGIAADKAARTEDRQHAVAMQDERLVASSQEQYFNRQANIETFLLGQSFEERALERKVEIAEKI